MTEDGFILFKQFLQEWNEAQKRKVAGRTHAVPISEKPQHDPVAVIRPAPSKPAYQRPEHEEDYTDSFCLLHSLTPKFPTYHEVLVSIVDYDFVAGDSWHLARVSNGRRLDVMRSGGGIMSRLLMDEPEGLVVDHKNRNQMDNRRGNLRVTTQRNNNVNSCRQRGGSSKYRGVYLSRDGRWHVRAGPRGSRVFIGSFATEEDAARAYNEFARSQYGEFAFQNPV